MGKLRNKIHKFITSKLRDSQLSYRTVSPNNCPYHPPIVNYRCHQNVAWHLENTKEVQRAFGGYYISSDTGQAIAHFIVEDVYDNFFDPTLPVHYMKGGKFYVVTGTLDIENLPQHKAGDVLMELKGRIRKALPWYIRWFTRDDTF